MKIKLLTLVATLFSMQNVYAATCSVSDVKIEGVSAVSCAGIFSGNVNSLEDVNTALSSSYTDYSNLLVTENTFSFSNIYSNEIEIVLKQNTSWAVYRFDLNSLNNVDGVWNGTWSTTGIQWDGNSRASGCQGCGELSHAAIAGNISEVPVPGTLSLLGLGLVALGALRKSAK